MAQPACIAIPDDVDFAALKLGRDASGVYFDWAPIERICAHSNLPVAMFRDSDESNASSLIVAWYRAHLAHGGAHDPVADDLITEARIEDEHGSLSHEPGRA